MTLAFGSLFSGIGGLDLGLERAGLRCVWQVELDDWCRRILAKHWPGLPMYRDVTQFCREDDDGEITAGRLLEEHGPIDLLVGGDPCQQHSRGSTAFESKTPSLAGEFLRIIEQIRPARVLRENPVSKSDAVGSWWRFRAGLERLGYGCVPFRVRACCVGADIRRERVFLYAELPQSEREGLEGHVGKILEGADHGRHHPDPAGPDRWHATPRVCRGADGIPHRVDRLRGLGNAVVPQVGEWIGRRILAAYTGART